MDIPSTQGQIKSGCAPKVIGDLEDFRLCCAEHRFFVDLGILELPVAVDNLQWLAERWGLVDDQDEIQSIMARAFGADQPAADEIPLQPEPQHNWVSKKPNYRTAQSTVDAFFWVARNESTEYLSRWLRDHPLDAPHLRDLWERKCQQT
jgi:hypothetical protein